MVIPCALGAASAAKAVGSGGATALGIGMGKSDMDQSRDLFKQQMRQAKRLWTADFAEASVRHGESMMQAAHQHAEAQAMATASYYQAEKLAGQGIKLARDQDSRAYEMAWRAEVRESLRDELCNQNNRFNIIMLCDTVCLGCVFTLVVETPPAETSILMQNAFVLGLGVSVMFFSISLWGSVIMVRRLHDNTAARLERKLFVQSEDLQKAWKHQVTKNLPTGAQEIYLLHQAYEKWVTEYIDPIGKMSIELLSLGVVTMFITAGILIHNVYLVDHDNFYAVPIIWSCVGVTCSTLLIMKFSEDNKEKKKQGVYDVSWQDQSSVGTGPYAKIVKAAEELSSRTAAALGSLERVESYGNQERNERELCTQPRLLHDRAMSLRRESVSRTEIRNEVLQLVTTAAEELDALPEELISRTNKILHSIDEADVRTADLVSTQPNAENTNTQQEQDDDDYHHHIFSPSGMSQSRRRVFQSSASPEQMGAHPIDAQRIPVSLGSLRKKLGEISHTTLLRLRNTSDEPLRLKSGVQLKEGKYIKSINANDPHGNAVCLHLYPGTEIPPRTEVLVASRSGGVWFPTSGIVGTIMYTNYDGSWTFEVSFRNDLIGNVRRCRVKAYQTNGANKNEDLAEEYQQYWEVFKDEYDGKANNEVLISFDVLSGAKASVRQRQSNLVLKNGYLLKKRQFGLGLHWQQRWCVLTPIEIVFSTDKSSEKQDRILVRHITKVRKDPDVLRRNTFQVYTNLVKSDPCCLATGSVEERDEWIKRIREAIQLVSASASTIGPSPLASRASGSTLFSPSLSGGEASTKTYPDQYSSDIEDGIECVHGEMKTEVLTCQ
eukprot:jgi/Psemu1/259922/estExt_Genewise1Plus.C_3990010